MRMWGDFRDIFMSKAELQFLEAASEASERYVRSIGMLNLYEVPASVCLRRHHGEEYFVKLNKRMGWRLGCGVFLIFAGLGVMGLGAPEDGLDILRELINALVYTGRILMVTGIALVVSGLRYKKYAADLIGEDVQRLEDVSELPVVPVTIEDPETFNKLKLVGDDYGFVGFIPSSQKIIIESLRFRQVIHANDTLDSYIQMAASVKSHAISYCVADPAASVLALDLPAEIDPDSVTMLAIARISLSSSSFLVKLKAGLSACLPTANDEGV